MKAAVIHAFDSPPRFDSFAEPVAAEGEEIVQVRTAGLHRIVRSLANGTHYGASKDLPQIAGVDGVGRLIDGARVYFGVTRAPFGSFAELAVTTTARCWTLPSNLDDATAAALVNPGISSWAALASRAKLVPGERVLILGATGVSGQLAVQAAKRLGAGRVTAAGRNPEALEALSDLGADEVISLNQEPEELVSALRTHISEIGVDIVLDYLWGSPAERMLEAIARKGLIQSAPRIRFVQVGSMAGTTISLQAATLRSSGIELLGSGFGSVSFDELHRSIAELLQEAAREPFKIGVKSASLRDVEALWNVEEPGVRLVFEP